MILKRRGSPRQPHHQRDEEAFSHKADPCDPDRYGHSKSRSLCSRVKAGNFKLVISALAFAFALNLALYLTRPCLVLDHVPASDSDSANGLVAGLGPTGPTDMSVGSTDTCVITISAWNNFGFVWNLYDSIVQNSPSIGCFVWFVGDISNHPDKAMDVIRRINTIAAQFTVVTMEDMESHLGNKFNPVELAFKFDMVELQTTLKPFAFQYTFEKLGAGSAIYLDNDIWVTDSLQPLQTHLRTRSALVTPHILSPVPEDGLMQKDLDFARSGVFNFGFVAFKNSPTANAFLQFWSERLSSYGFLEPEKGMFWDQNWGVFIPAFLDHEDYMVIRDPRYNVAYWNLHYTGARVHLDKKSGLPYLDDQPVVFFHFSGMSLLEEFDMHGISRYQNRYTLDDFPRLEELFKAYIYKLQEHDALDFRAIPYGYTTFSNGYTIEPGMRRSYAAIVCYNNLVSAANNYEFLTTLKLMSYSTSNIVAFQKNVAEDPFCASRICKGEKSLTFLEWSLMSQLDLSVDLEGRFFFTGVEHSVWKKRPDLQQAFPNPMSNDDHSNFKQWFVNTAVAEGMVSKDVYKMWHDKWKYHFENHEMFHKTVSGNNDIGINIIGWHGGQFSIGILASSIYFVASEAKIVTNNILLPNVSNKKHTNPSLLGYELTRSPSEIVNFFAFNADWTYPTMGNVPKIIWENKYNIGYFHWELDIFPQQWMGCLKEFDEIWTSSDFIKNSIESSPGYDSTPVKVLNLPLLKSEKHDSEVEPTSLPFEISSLESSAKPFVFLVVFDFQSSKERKNPLAAIRAFLDAFPASSDPTGKYRIVVKSHSGTPKEMEEMRTEARSDPRVVLVNRFLSDNENVALHNYQDCYVSLHRSEGYGLNILESMGAGIPVIATNYSGNVQFFDADPSLVDHCLFPVPYKLLTLEETVLQYEAGNHWADPDHEYAVRAMKSVAKNKCKAKQGTKISEAAYNGFGVDAVGRQLQTLLREATPRILEKQKAIETRGIEMHEIIKGWINSSAIE